MYLKSPHLFFVPIIPSGNNLKRELEKNLDQFFYELRTLGRTLLVLG
jgi:hypothetical protein